MAAGLEDPGDGGTGVGGPDVVVGGTDVVVEGATGLGDRPFLPAGTDVGGTATDGTDVEVTGALGEVVDGTPVVGDGPAVVLTAVDDEEEPALDVAVTVPAVATTVGTAISPIVAAQIPITAHVPAAARRLAREYRVVLEERSPFVITQVPFLLWRSTPRKVRARTSPDYPPAVEIAKTPIDLLQPGDYAMVR